MRYPWRGDNLTSDLRTKIFLNSQNNSMNDNVAISLDVSRIYDGCFEHQTPETPLDLQIYLNKEKIFEFDKSLQQSNFCTEITDLPLDSCYTLKFVMSNKTVDHTKVDPEGNVLGDCRIAIKNLAFNKIELGHLFVEQAEYVHSKNETDTVPVKDKFYGEMGCNGTVSLQFYTPTYIWLLEHL
jgi:hypothetical protein